MDDKQELLRSRREQYLTEGYTDVDSTYEEERYSNDDEHDVVDEENSGDKGGWLLSGQRRRIRSVWSWGRVLNPRSKWVQEWNMIYLVACATWLFVDPIFVYALSVSSTAMCVYLDGWMAATVTVIRAMADAFHLLNMWLQFKTAKGLPLYLRDGAGGDSRSSDGEENGGTRGMSPRSVALRYLKAKKGFFFDLFVIVPIPQVVVWVIVPSLLKRGSAGFGMTVVLLAYLFQYLPKMYHGFCVLRRTQKLSGYIFGTIGWSLTLNIIFFFIASHGLGACWYVLGIQRATKCLVEQCWNVTTGCDTRVLSCNAPIYYGTTNLVTGRNRVAWSEYKPAHETCLDDSSHYGYGSYSWAVQLFACDNRLIKIIYPIFWSLMTVCTMGNTWSTYDWAESLLLIITLTLGLVLMTMLLGNIKLSAQAATSKKQAMQFKMQDIESWMRKRNLPQGFRERVRNFERQRWAATRGVDETEMVQNLPEGLRRDIKYHLCLDLVRQVPLFQHMDDLVLENICDRVKSLIFTKEETIQKEGDPVQRMLFVVRGHLQSSQVLRDGVKSCCTLGPGNFSGDELLSWCLRTPFIERLPPSTSTLITLETTECFALEAEDVKYITQHFRYTFVNEKVKRSARYYSPGWRTWAAVAIQLAWRRCKRRQTFPVSFSRPRRPLLRSSSSIGEDRLRLYTAILTSPKPNQDDFDI